MWDCDVRNRVCGFVMCVLSSLRGKRNTTVVKLYGLLISPEAFFISTYCMFREESSQTDTCRKIPELIAAGGVQVKINSQSEPSCTLNRNDRAVNSLLSLHESLNQSWVIWGEARRTLKSPPPLNAYISLCAEINHCRCQTSCLNPFLPLKVLCVSLYQDKNMLKKDKAGVIHMFTH